MDVEPKCCKWCFKCWMHENIRYMVEKWYHLKHVLAFSENRYQTQIYLNGIWNIENYPFWLLKFFLTCCLIFLRHSIDLSNILIISLSTRHEICASGELVLFNYKLYTICNDMILTCTELFHESEIKNIFSACLLNETPIDYYTIAH